MEYTVFLWKYGLDDCLESFVEYLIEERGFSYRQAQKSAPRLYRFEKGGKIKW